MFVQEAHPQQLSNCRLLGVLFFEERECFKLIFSKEVDRVGHRYRHDPSKVAVCLSWLHGTCSRGDCKQQHARRPELMPNCVHFMMGRCVRSDCPYSHAVVHPNAPLCTNFSNGYCSNGCHCARKHYTSKMVGYQEPTANNGDRRLGVGGVGGWALTTFITIVTSFAVVNTCQTLFIICVLLCM